MRDTYQSVTPSFVFDDPAYSGLALERASEYQNAQPFPHIAIDGFLPPALATELADAFPVQDQTDWIIRDNANNRRRFLQDERKMPEMFRHMCREFNSPQFLLFLETLTGIDNLLPDPRVNALLYLSRGWQEDWKGTLELRNREMTRPVVLFYPLFNRLVVFNVGERSNHGQPQPNACPEGVYRLVMNMYYYTARNPDGAIDEPHFTMYKTKSQLSACLRESYVRAGQEYARARHGRELVACQ